MSIWIGCLVLAVNFLLLLGLACAKSYVLDDRLKLSRRWGRFSRMVIRQGPAVFYIAPIGMLVTLPNKSMYTNMFIGIESALLVVTALTTIAMMPAIYKLDDAIDDALFDYAKAFLVSQSLVLVLQISQFMIRFM